LVSLKENLKALVSAGNALDEHGFFSEAEKIDDVIKKISSSVEGLNHDNEIVDKPEKNTVDSVFANFSSLSEEEKDEFLSIVIGELDDNSGYKNEE